MRLLVPVTFAAGSYVYGDISLPRVDALAARAQSGQLWLALTNLDPNRTAQVEVTFGWCKARRG